jgi:hypothetical protein
MAIRTTSLAFSDSSIKLCGYRVPPSQRRIRSHRIRYRRSRGIPPELKQIPNLKRTRRSRKTNMSKADDVPPKINNASISELKATSDDAIAPVLLPSRFFTNGAVHEVPQLRPIAYPHGHPSRTRLHCRLGRCSSRILRIQSRFPTSQVMEHAVRGDILSSQRGAIFVDHVHRIRNRLRGQERGCLGMTGV